MARKKQILRYAISGIYQGSRIEYVHKNSNELRPELERIHRGITSAIRALCWMRPLLRHVVVKTTLYQLEAALRELPESTPEAELAAEISRLNILMEDALFNLNKLTHCRVQSIEQARFSLTYGQTPKKRDLPGKEDEDIIPQQNPEEP